MSKTVAILTQGCKVNQYESEAIAEAFCAAGFSVISPSLPADAYVINTCTVTAESDRKAGQLIRRVQSQNPDAIVLVTGCFAQADTAAVAKIPGVDYICGNDRKLSVVEAAERLLAAGKNPAPVLSVADLAKAAFEPMRITRYDRTRAYVKIEDGCENRCAYCAIPGARGRVRSKPLAEVVAEVEGLVAGGCREVVLTGIETASWGQDLGDASLIDLLEAVDATPGLERMRLGSLYPTLITEDFAHRLGALCHLAPHFHLSVQSGSSAVLKAMNRRYTAEEAMAALQRLRSAVPNAEFTADFIVGFPGENDAHFAETLRFVEEAEFLQIHVFSYSRRKGTVAAGLPGQIPTAIKKARSTALIARGRECRVRRLEKALESPHRLVLLETFSDGVALGHTDNFLEVAIPTDRPLHGELIPVRLREVAHDHLIAEWEDCQWKNK